MKNVYFCVCGGGGIVFNINIENALCIQPFFRQTQQDWQNIFFKTFVARDGGTRSVCMI